VSPNIHSLGIDRLSAEDRLRLIDEIWDSLDREIQHAELLPWQEELLDRRIAEADANPGQGSPWDEVKARLLAEADDE
jgi:putative addiction module component (TIGR02574 family)